MTALPDVRLIGGGNAALCAAPTAREALVAGGPGARVLLLEAAPREWRGGNSAHTRSIPCMHDTPQDVLTGATRRRSSGRTCTRSPGAAPTRRWRGS